MSLAEGVRFRHLLCRLNQAEATTFISNLWRDHSDIIIRSLFSHIKQPSNCTAAKAVNKSISDIIESRKSKQKAKSEASSISLGQLPHVLVGETASFLAQTDFAHFSQSSRFLFIWPNS